MQIAEYIIPYFVELIGSFITEEIKYLYSVKEQINSLKLKLRYLQSFLKDVTERSHKQENSSNQLLQTHVKEITKLASEIETVIDIYTFVLDQGRFWSVLVCRPCILVDIHRVGMKIDRIQRRLQDAIGMFNDLGNAGSFSEEEEPSSCNIRSRL